MKGLIQIYYFTQKVFTFGVSEISKIKVYTSYVDIVYMYLRIIIQVLHKSAFYKYCSTLRENVKRSLSYTSVGEVAPSVNLPCKADARLDRTHCSFDVSYIDCAAH